MTDCTGKMQERKTGARQLVSRAATYLSSVIRHLSSLLWHFAREVSGEAAYERHLRHARGGRVDARAIFLHTLEEKYSRPSRCC